MSRPPRSAAPAMRSRRTARSSFARSSSSAASCGSTSSGPARRSPRATAQSPTDPARTSCTSVWTATRSSSSRARRSGSRAGATRSWTTRLLAADSTGGGDTLAGLRLHLTSAHAGLPAGTDIVLGRVHADLAHIPPAPASQPGGSGGSGSTGTVPDRQANAPGTHHRPVRRRRHASGDRGAAAPPARAATARARQAPCHPAASGRPRHRSTRRARAGGSGPGRLAVRLGRREPDGGRVRLLRPR